MASNLVERQSSTPMGLTFQPARILIVDDESIIRDILARKLSSLGHSCDHCENGREALERLAAGSYDMVLADVMMPEMGGVTLLTKALQMWPDLAVILVTSVIDIEVAVDALKDGAYDYITKPFSLEEVALRVTRALDKRRLRIENQKYQRTLEEQVASRTRQLKEALVVLQETYHSTLMALGTALDSRDADSDGHAVRVTMYTTQLAIRLGLSEAEIQVIQQGALLHDIGKIGIPDAVLRKPGKLTESEWVLMRRHPEIGFRILSGIKLLKGAAELVLHHQERFDGTGYPHGLRGDAIVLGARIFAVADTLDCMTSKRPFQAATTFEAARDEILRVAGSQLDPTVVEVFAKIPLEEWKRIREQVAGK